ncbi:MAG TPA: PPOX class F420-dependent oxidoreductase [Anaerolineales bacterium]|nr:PPOX class F420-dependent oxidoreductase [Anaerolineales bacterium]
MNTPASHADLLEDKTRAYAYLATIMPDGTPQVTPVWFNTDGDCILINTAKGRVKDKNMRARPGVALVIADPRDTLRYVQIRGHVVEFTESGALSHISVLSMKYHGKPWTPVSGQERVIFRIQPEHISAS